MRFWSGFWYGGWGWALLLFLLMYFLGGCGRWRWWRWVGGCCSGGYRGAPPGTDGPSREDFRALDPTCGMWVDKRTARHLHVDGQDYYFCSEACQKKFEAMKNRGKEKA